jgi:hypothetical protein
LPRWTGIEQREQQDRVSRFEKLGRRKRLTADEQDELDRINRELGRSAPQTGGGLNASLLPGSVVPGAPQAFTHLALASHTQLLSMQSDSPPSAVPDRSLKRKGGEIRPDRA